LKASFIDTGKIRFVFREFPLDIKAAAGSMLARCLANGEPEKYFAAIDLLFRTQNDWVSGNSPDGLKRIAIQAGLGTKGFQDCLANDEMLNAIKQTRESAIARLDVKSTPTFFVDGVRVNETGTFEALEEAITSRLTH
jgi:protein-disulfide isomerase